MICGLFWKKNPTLNYIFMEIYYKLIYNICLYFFFFQIYIFNIIFVTLDDAINFLILPFFVVLFFYFFKDKSVQLHTKKGFFVPIFTGVA